MHQTVYSEDRYRKLLMQQAADKIEELEKKLWSIVGAVGIKWHGETREQTAIRYIVERENSCRAESVAQYEPSFHGARTDAV